jgi:hypothetical protein
LRRRSIASRSEDFGSGRNPTVPELPLFQVPGARLRAQIGVGLGEGGGGLRPRDDVVAVENQQPVEQFGGGWII